MDVPSWAAEKFLYSKLNGDATLVAQGVTAVYVDDVPDGAPARYVFITNLDAQDVSYVGHNIGWSTLLYAVRIVGAVNGYGALTTAAARLHTLLHRSSGSTDAGRALAVYRERPFRMVERGADRTIYHLGGIFRILVKD